MQYDLGFLPLVGRRKNLQLFPSLASSPQRFRSPVLISFHHRIGRRQNYRCGAVVLFQFEHLGILEHLGKIQDIGDVRPPPAIDRLVVIAHYANLPVLLSQPLDELELGPVGILVLIHQHILETLAVILQYFRILVE